MNQQMIPPVFPAPAASTPRLRLRKQPISSCDVTLDVTPVSETQVLNLWPEEGAGCFSWPDCRNTFAVLTRGGYTLYEGGKGGKMKGERGDTLT